MATQYQVNINMDPTQQEQMHSVGFRLHGFKAVRTSSGGGAPLLWFDSDRYSTSTEVSWETQYQAYTSRSEIVARGQIKASHEVDIDLGETFEVTGTGGTGNTVGRGTPSIISIHNKTTTQFSCGVSQSEGGEAKPICVFPLFGNHLDQFAPIEKVLLMFSTREIRTASAIMKAYSPGILVDLTGAPGNLREVSYDLNGGWSWGGGTWARQVEANADLAPLLIENSALALRAAADAA